MTTLGRGLTPFRTDAYFVALGFVATGWFSLSYEKIGGFLFPPHTVTDVLLGRH